MTDIITNAQKAKNASYTMAVLSRDAKNDALRAIYDRLNDRKEEIFASNLADMANAKKMHCRLRSGRDLGLTKES